MALTSRHKVHQAGNFSVELALVLVLACGFFYFVSDLSGQLIRQSRLDTVAYTLTNVIKERDKFFEGTAWYWLNENDESEYELLDQLALMLLKESDSLITQSSDYGISFEVAMASGLSGIYCQRPIGRDAIDCDWDGDEWSEDLKSFVPQDHNKDDDDLLYAYRVAISIQTTSMFSRFFGQDDRLTLRSFAILPGRFFDDEG